MEAISFLTLSRYLKKRPLDFYKGNAGHLLIVGGNIGYSGAVRLAGEAALRVGAGLVTIGTRVEHAGYLNVGCFELMCHGVTSEKQIGEFVKKADAIVLGPGLGQDEWSSMLLDVIFASEKPMVVDADALNLLAKHPIKKSNWILTPHPGEAARLLGVSSEVIQSDRCAAVEEIQEKFSGVCVLKGYRTLVCEGNKNTVVCEQGNPGMATAGMGDVLSGVIGGLLAQGVPLGNATQLGVVVHALAGDKSAEQGERGMRASDLMPCLREVVNVG